MTSSGSLDPLLTYICITLSWNVIYSSKYCNVARIQKIWNLYKIINFRKFSNNKIATAGFPRAAEPWRFLRICQIDINWKSQKHSPHQFILFWNFSKCLSGVEGGGGGSLTPPEVEVWSKLVACNFCGIAIPLFISQYLRYNHSLLLS